MVAYLLAALMLVLFAVGVRRDRRRFSNAVLLGLAAVLAVVGLAGELDRLPDEVIDAATAALPAAALLGAAATGALLVANGVHMVRQEGGRPANLLSLLAGLAVFALIGVLWAAVRVDSPVLHAVAASALLLAGYLSFLLLCFLGYAVLYRRLGTRRDVDFVVVLGAGLLNGDRVPPLLAARLDTALGVYEEQAARGRAPVVVVSGGKGDDEQVSEAEAMARHLAARGLPPGAVRLEDRSENTAQNMEYSAALMAAERPGYRCVVVTNTFHVLRAALATRRAGVTGQVIGAPTAGYYWPSAVLREFAAVIVSYPATNATLGVLLVALGVEAGRP
ncbi:membrane protein [Kitasatospora sp. NE20-6]|uniref:YdcF family protein n=1 Tax=Kitasatospora sp. NE20-6 TaxID=2859066 RepID=UPI0034DBB257